MNTTGNNNMTEKESQLRKTLFNAANTCVLNNEAYILKHGCWVSASERKSIKPSKERT